MSLEPIAPSVKNYPKFTDTTWARLQYWIPILFTFHFSLLISNCGLDIEDPTPPSAPHWVQKSLPEEWPELGIDAHESGGINLEWESNPVDEDVAKYYIYRATYFDINDSLSPYDLLMSINVESNRLCKYTDQWVSIGIRYFYKLRAENQSESISTFSDSITYLSLPIIEYETLKPNGLMVELGNNRELSWTYRTPLVLEHYCITILNTENNLMVRSLFPPGNYIGDTDYWAIPIEVDLITNETYKWRVDLSSQYFDRFETAGSESGWATFLYAASN